MATQATYDPKSSPWYCEHAETQVRKRTQSDGRTVACRQCLRCGASLGNVAKNRVPYVAVLPAWDEALQKSWRERGQTEFDQRRQDEQDAFWKWYNAYLLSPEWRVLRSKVLKRADGVCEGCGERPAVQVHHLTYARVGKEMLFDLVAVCQFCHDRIHEDRETRPLPQKG